MISNLLSVVCSLDPFLWYFSFDIDSRSLVSFAIFQPESPSVSLLLSLDL